MSHATARFTGVLLLLALMLCENAWAYPEKYTRFADNFLTAQNALSLNLQGVDTPSGSLTVYRHSGGTYIPLKQFAETLGFTCTIDDGAGAAAITYPQTGFTTELLLYRQEYIANGTVKRFFFNEVLVDDFEYYIDATLLPNLLPVTLSVNEANLTLKVTRTKTFPKPPADTKKEPGDLPSPSSEETVNISAKQPATDQPTETVLPQQATDSIPGDSEVMKPEEELLVLQPQLQGFPPFDLFVEAYLLNGVLYLPLPDMFEQLEFQIDTSTDNRRMEGWFASEENRFRLNRDSRSITSKGREVKLSEHDLLERDGILFGSAPALQQWFGIECTLDRKTMSAIIIPHLRLPIQARQERQARWKQYLGSYTREKPPLPAVTSEYQSASVPFVDMAINQSLRSQSGETNGTMDYSLAAGGEIGYLTMDMYAAGSSNRRLVNNLRIKAGRKDPEANLLGPWQATEVFAGDIDSQSLPLTTQTSLGRGFRMTNRPLDVSSEFGTRDFTGDAPPNWEVELYRNNILLEFQLVEGDGRYQFLKVPVLYGNNTFRLVFYGPQGQVEEKVEHFFAGNNLLKPAELHYGLSVDEKSASTFGISKLATPNSPTGLRAIADMKYGVSDTVTAGLGVAHTPLVTGDHQYLQGSITAMHGGLLTNLDLAMDTGNQGWAGNLQLLTSIQDISIRARHSHFENFSSEVENGLANPRLTSSNLEFNGQFMPPLIHDINLGGEILHETFVNGNSITTYRKRLYKSLFGLGFNHTLEYVQGNRNRLNGELNIQGRLHDILFRSAVIYLLKPDPEVSSVSLTMHKKLAERVTSRTRIIHEPRQDNTALHQAVNWAHDGYDLTMQGEVNNELDTFLGVNLSFAFGRNPRTGNFHFQSKSMAASGAITAFVFMDDNYNGRFDDGEQILPKSAIRVNKKRHDANDGHVFAAPIQSFNPTDVTVDLSSVKDPLLYPAIEGYRVTTRPGSIIPLSFPLVSTSEIDGQVVLEEEDGQFSDLPDVLIQAVNAQGSIMHDVISEYDGFYFIRKVIPGRYRMQVADAYLEEYGYEQVTFPSLTITRESDFYSDQTIILRKIVPSPGETLINSAVTYTLPEAGQSFDPPL